MLGSIVVQGAWIYNGYKQSEAHLREQMNAALVEAVEDLNNVGEMAFIARVSANEEQGVEHAIRHEVHMIQTTDISITEDSIGFEVVMDSLKHSLVRLTDSKDDSAKRPVMVRMQYTSEDGEKDVETRIEWTGDSLVEEVLALEQEGRLKKIVERIELENLLGQSDWKNRLDSAGLAMGIATRLKQRGIEEAFEFAVVNEKMQPYDGFSSSGFDTAQIASGSKTSLFPRDLRVKPLFASVYLPSFFAHVMAEMWGLIIGSLVFTTLMIILFIVTLKQLLSQSKLNRMKTDFINNMSHELKTPLATISLATDALEHPTTSENPQLVKTFTSTIKQEHHRMHEHIERVLQMAQSEVGHFQLAPEPVNVAELIRSLIEDFKLVLEERNARVEFNPETESVIIPADPFHLRSALSNLIDNGLKYNRNEPIIRIGLELRNDLLFIEVCDNGIGIEPSQQELIFSRFYRVPTGNVHAVKGFGLGLSYVSMVVKAHNGAVALKSTPGEGTCFTVSLPRE